MDVFFLCLDDRKVGQQKDTREVEYLVADPGRGIRAPVK